VAKFSKPLHYPRAFDSIGMAYTKELMGIREKN